MITQWAGLSWLAMRHMWLAPVFVFLIILIVMRAKRVLNIHNLLTSPRWRSFLLQNSSKVRLVIQSVLMIFGLIALFFAFLRPAIQQGEQIVEQEGRDLFIAVDISRSMLAQDLQPNRLEMAKRKIRSLVSRLKAERVGLILFSGNAIVQCPLTTDIAAFYMFLDTIDSETISSGTTAIDKAIRKAIDAYAGFEDKKSKLLVLFTDGEDFSSNLAGLKKKANELGIHIFTVGVATQEGAPIPEFDKNGKPSGHIVDKRGKVVISKLNEGILQSLAIDSGGIYLPVTQNNSDLNQLISKIEQFEKEKFDDKKIELFEEQYTYFVAMSFICFALAWFL